MTDEERQRLEGIRDFLPLDDSWANGQILWLLDLVERQEAEIAGEKTKRSALEDVIIALADAFRADREGSNP